MTPAVPELLERLRAGDESALNALVTVLYEELHRLAAGKLKHERSGHTLQPTALVNEAYMKLVGDHPRRFADKVHFLSVVSRVMRQVLIDYARNRAAKKRSGQGSAIAPLAGTTVEVDGGAGMGHFEVLDLDSALDALAKEDESLAQLIELHYFGGMTAEESAELLGKSVHTMRHDIRLAQAWLRRKVRE